MRVSVNVIRTNSNAVSLCNAFADGIAAIGDVAVKRTERDNNMSGFDAAVLWGYTLPCQHVARSCKNAGIPWVFMDNGYLKRDRYFKVTLNDRHPTAYIMTRDMPNDRFASLDRSIEPWRANGRHIVVAGMSPKAAWSWGKEFEAWERETIAKLCKVTVRPIIYRPKSNSPGAKRIEGSTVSTSGPIDQLLRDAHCVITHHSNVGCDALYAGVPVFTRFGAALPLAHTDTELVNLENPHRPDNREQWAANLAYCQWTADEMRSGACWAHFKELMKA